MKSHTLWLQLQRWRDQVGRNSYLCSHRVYLAQQALWETKELS